MGRGHKLLDPTETKWKTFNHCKHFGEESYIFISTNEIDHLTSSYLCMIWLNWSLKFHTRLWTKFILDTHIQHTSLMFNEYLFYLRDCTCLNVMCVHSTICRSNQKVFDYFICFWKHFVSPMFFKVFQVDFVWKTCFLGVFETHFVSGSKSRDF